MPVASETSRIQYTGNNSTVTAYTVPFYFLANADVKVVLTTSAGVETTLTETTHYTLTGAANPAGGSVVTVSAYDNTHTVTIYREPQQTQSAEFQPTGALPAATLTAGLDKLTMLVQSLSRKVARCFRLNDKASDVNALSEADRENTVFGFDSSGNPTLRDSAALLSMLSLSGSVTGASTAFWADNGERALKVPDFVGQVGVQLDTRVIYTSTATTAGSWTQLNLAEIAGILTAGQVPAGLITYGKIQDISTTQRLLGRNTAGAGNTEEVTLTQLLDWIGSAAQGDILYRGAASWARLAAGSAGQALITGGSGANPSWASGSIVKVTRVTDTATYDTATTTPALDDTIPQIGEGAQFFTTSYTPVLATSTLMLRLTAMASGSTTLNLAFALFVDGAANAVSASTVTINGANYTVPLTLVGQYSNTTTAAKAITARFGTSTGTGYINRISGGGIFSTSDKITLEILEVAP